VKLLDVPSDAFFPAECCIRVAVAASVVTRMLNTPQLPSLAREKIIEYVNEKRAGFYGHNERQIERFVAGLSVPLLGSILRGRE